MDSQNRRGGLIIAGLFLLTVVSIIAGTLTSGESPGWLFLVGIVGLLAVVIGGSLWTVKARTGSVWSPMLGLPAGVRTRVVHAMRRQEPLADAAEQRLALDEARRLRRLTPVTVSLMTLTTLLMIGGVVLRLTDDDSEPWEVALSVATAALFAFAAVQQVLAHRRSGAYLDRFAEAGAR